MGENKSHHQNNPYPSSSRLGQRNSSKTIGEIVEVQGGHIVRSTGRKDRHSKVCTAKGPRDRRVRLAAHTAIQFYDVQDRLGYDRPSKAVDWLIKQAKAAIDELAQLPPWHPSGCNNAASHGDQGRKIQEDGREQEQVGLDGLAVKRASSFVRGEDEKGHTSDINVQDSTFLPQQLDSDAIADTIKSFFPTGSTADSSCSSAHVQFHNFSTHDLMSRSGHSQDLNLSLQSLQDPISMNNHSSTQQTMQQHVNSQAHHHVLLSGNPVGYDGNSFAWLDQNNQRIQSWNNASVDLFGSQTASQPMLQQLLGQNQFFATQRGPLQSSNNTPSVHAWMDQFSTIDHQHQGLIVPVYPSSSVSGIGFASGISGYTGFHVPARIRGDNEDRIDGFSDKPSSASSDSHH